MSKTGEKSYVLRVGIKTMFCGLNKSHLAAIITMCMRKTG